MYLTYQDISTRRRSNAKQQPNATDPVSRRSVLHHLTAPATVRKAGYGRKLTSRLSPQVPPVDVRTSPLHPWPCSPLFTTEAKKRTSWRQIQVCIHVGQLLGHDINIDFKLQRGRCVRNSLNKNTSTMDAGF